MHGLPASSLCVCVGPPLYANDGSSIRIEGISRLLAPVSTNPELEPMALKFTLTVPRLEMSGAEPATLPETIVLSTEIMPVPAPPAMPPPLPPAALAVIVLFCTTSVPLKEASAMPPPSDDDLPPEMVLLRTVI